MAAQLIAMEKTIEASELLEMVVETEAGAGATGLRVAGGGKEGLFVKDVLKDSPAARVLSLQEGDQLLSARVYFDNIKYEDALQILKCAEPYKISFCLKRVVPSTDVSRRPGTSVLEVRGPEAKVAKLNIQSLSSLKRKKKKKMKKRVMVKKLQETEAGGTEDLAAGKLEIIPVDVEFSLPRFSKLHKAKKSGKVAVAEPSLDLSLKFSSLQTKRHKLKFPRLKVKEAAAAAAAARVEGAGKGGVEGKTFPFTIPFPKTRKPKEEAGDKMEMGFQAPQVELTLPLTKTGPGDESLKASTKGKSLGIPEYQLGLPKVGASSMEICEGVLQAGLKLPTAEVAAPKVDVDLALPKLECVVPEVAPKREGFRIKIPKFGISAEEAELKLPLMKAPALGEKAEALESKLKPGVAMPSLGVAAPAVALELPLPKGKTGMESPEISVKAPLLSPPKLGSRAQEEGEGKRPQVEISIGKLESPKAAQMKGSIIQIPGLEISLVEQQLESEKVVVAADNSKVKYPEIGMPSLDISAPKVQDMHFSKAMGDLAAPSGRAKPKEAAEGAGFKFQMPQISLPKFELPVKAAPSPPPVHVKMQKPEVDIGAKVNLPKVDFSLPAVKMPGVQFSKLPKPELDISVEQPKVEVTMSPAQLSFPSATVPTLDIELPKVGVELDLAQVEKDVSKQVPKAHEVTLETVSKGLEVEISVPKCQMSQPELEPRMKTIEGPTISGMVAKIPKVDLAFEKQPTDTEGAETNLGMWPKTELEVGGFAPGTKMKLPTIEIPVVGPPEITVESQAKLKSSQFALSKFSISGPKVWSKTSPEVSVSEVEGAEDADLGPRLKLPKFGISFPKSKQGAEVDDAKLALEVEGQVPKERLEKATESRMKLPVVEVDIGLSQGKEEWSGIHGEGASPELGIELPDVKFKVPKFSLPKFGSKGKEEEWGPLESGEVKLQGSKGGLAGQVDTRMLEKDAKASKFRIPSFGLMRREVEMHSLEAEAKGKKVPGSPKEKPKGPFGKMPKLRLSSLKAEEDKGKFHLPAPKLDVKVLPQVEFPKLDTRTKTELISEPENPSFKIQMPTVEIAVPGPKPEGEVTLEKLTVDVSKGEIHGYEEELKIPKVPSIDVSSPTVELDIGLSVAGKEEGILQAAPSTDAKIKLPEVELAKLGKGEDGGTETAMQLLGRRLSFGKEGEKDPAGISEASALGTKIRLPKVDISLPKARLSDVEVEVGLEGPEVKFKMPSMGLPKFSTPKVKAPELGFDVSLEGGMMPKIKVGAPSVKWPKFRASGSEGERKGEEDLPRMPQLELKAPKLRGSTEALSSEIGAKEGKLKMPALPLGLGKLEMEGDESKFKLKLPSLSISKPDAELSIDAQPLCPPAQEAELAFKVPQVALPDIGFSVDQEWEKGARVEAEAVAGAADLEVDMGGLEGMLRVPKIGMPTFGPVGIKGGMETTTSQSQRGRGGGDVKKSVFKVPGLEISAPSLKTHAEYEVERAHIQRRGSLDLEGTDSDGWKRSEDHSDAGAGKRYKVKMPRFGLFLPKAGLGAPESSAGQEAEAKAKRPLFALGRPRGSRTEGSSELLERGESEAKGVRTKLKLKPTFALSRSKPKQGAELNGEVEEASSKLKVPKLGFSKAEGAAQLNGERLEVLLQDGASKLGKIRLPQVELSSPSKPAEADPELNLQLMKAEEAPRGSSISTALKAAKFRSPRILLSGFKKRNGGPAPEAAIAPLPQMEAGPLEGESSTKFRFPKVVVSSGSQGVLEISEHQQDLGGLNVKLPAVTFSSESGTEEIVGDPRRSGSKAGEKEAAAVAAAAPL